MCVLFVLYICLCCLFWFKDILALCILRGLLTLTVLILIHFLLVYFERFAGNLGIVLLLFNKRFFDYFYFYFLNFQSYILPFDLSLGYSMCMLYVRKINTGVGSLVPWKPNFAQLVPSEVNISAQMNHLIEKVRSQLF